MPKAAEIARVFDESFPFADACSYDNVGLLVGREGAEITKALIALDVTKEVAEEAAALGAEIVISHHPVIFREIKRVTDGSYTGQVLLSLIEKGIGVISLHTNYDKGEEGNNDALARALGATLYEKIEDGFATEFDLAEPIAFPLFAERVREALGDRTVRTIDCGRVSRVIASCGAGIDEGLILRAKRDGAVIVTADVKHNYASMARDLSVGLVEVTHYASEWGFTREISRFMSEHFAEVECFVSRKNINPYDAS